MAFKIKFEKIQGSWFAMLPEYIEAGGDFEDCQMVLNTPEMLDILSEGENEVEVLIDNKPIIDCDIRFLLNKTEFDWGFYTPHPDSKILFDKEIGLCPVNMFVWNGKHPDWIYIKK